MDIIRNNIYTQEANSFAKLLAKRKAWQDRGLTVAWTNGVFDILHAGHIRSLEAARAIGDVLIVGLNSDHSVRQLKGVGRPILPQNERAELLAALRCVDAVLIFEETTPEGPLSRLKPDIHCKGADYAPPHGKAIPEKELVESYGGKVVFLPLLDDVSTTDIIQRILTGSPSGQDVSPSTIPLSQSSVPLTSPDRT